MSSRQLQFDTSCYQLALVASLEQSGCYMKTNQKVAEVISSVLTSLLPIATSFTVASLASLSEVVSMEAFDFSGITVPAGFFEDDIHLKRVQTSVSRGILKKIDETAKNQDINAIPEELHLLPRDMMVE